MEATDQQLVNRALDGSLDAFDQLMLRYQGLCFQIAFNYCRNKEQALDIVQDVFLKAYRKLPTLTEGNLFKPWLIRITYNQSVSYFRKPQHQESLVLEEDMQLDPANQESLLIEDERRKLLSHFLDQLNPKHRLALILKYFEGLPLKEIAQVLQTSEDVVKNMIYRSMRKLAEAASDFSAGEKEPI